MRKIPTLDYQGVADKKTPCYAILERSVNSTQKQHRARPLGAFFMP